MQTLYQNQLQPRHLRHISIRDLCEHLMTLNESEPYQEQKESLDEVKMSLPLPDYQISGHQSVIADGQHELHQSYR